MYKVYGMARNRTFRVLWMLEELGAAYDYVEMMPRSPECFALNPSGKVPILEDDGETVTDSVAIITYLADKHGALTAPAGSLARGRQDAMTQFTVDEVEGALWNISKHKFVLPKEMRIPEMREVCVYDFDRAMTSLEKRLEAHGGPYATGTEFSVPDILLGHCSVWADFVKLERPAGPVSAYFDRLKSRPAFIATDEKYPPR